MTICIAAICDADNSSKIVFCADRLVTDEKGLTFEQGRPKINAVSKNCIVMNAGLAYEADEIIEDATAYVNEESLKGNILTIEEIAYIFKSLHQKVRQRCVEDEILRPRGLTLKEFYDSVKNYPDWLGIMMDNQIVGYDFQLNFLIFGFDISEDKKAYTPHLYFLDSKGEVNILTTAGFGIIGIGDIMSMPEMTRETYNINCSLPEAVVRTYAAKKSAERVVSVGRDTTDLGIMWVDPDEQRNAIVKNILTDKKFIKELYEGYKVQMEKMKETNEALKINIGDLLSGKKQSAIVNTPSKT